MVRQKQNNFGVTGLMLVKNEENWVKYAINSVLPELDSLIVFDSGSTDRTKEIVTSKKSSKVTFKEFNVSSADEVTNLRNQMIDEVKTEWFLLVDGDEVWNNDTLKKFVEFLKDLPKTIYGVAMRTRNCVGDVYHYLPESAGRYKILGHQGHLTIRAYRKQPGFRWQGEYPLEAYTSPEGQAINSQDKHLAFFEGFYWHMTHLERTSTNKKTLGFRKRKNDRGLAIKSIKDLPEVLLEPIRSSEFNPLDRRSLGYEIKARILEPIKKIKWRLENF